MRLSHFLRGTHDVWKLDRLIREVISNATYRTRPHLHDHPFLRWFVLPILFMGGVIAFTAITVGNLSLWEIVQVVGLFVGFSVAWVILGLGIERGLRSAFGWWRQE